MTSVFHLGSNFYQLICSPNFCVLHLAPQILQGLTDADVGGIAPFHRGIDLLQNFANLLAREPDTLFVLIGKTETLVQESLHIVRSDERQIGCLNASHFIVAEPKRHHFIANFVLHLSIKLGMIDGREVIDERTFLDAQTQITTTSCRIAKRVRVVGRSKEACIADSVLLRLAKDGTAVDLHLRERLLQFPLMLVSPSISCSGMLPVVSGAKSKLMWSR